MPLLFLRAMLGGIGKWLSSLSFWQIVCIACVAFAGLQTVRLWAEQRHSAKVQTQLTKLSAQLQKITTAKNEQKHETAERIKVVTRTIHDADERAKVVENAPPAKDCRTKPEVMNADI